MAIQTTYTDGLSAAFAGMVADTTPATIISRTVETAAIGFGLPVTQGANDRGCDGDVSSATEITGITVRDQAVEAGTPDEYPAGETAALMRKGSIWVTVTDAGGVSPGDAVWVDLANGTFSNADVGSGNGLKLPGCRWDTTGANGALARISVDLDVPAVAGAA